MYRAVCLYSLQNNIISDGKIDVNLLLKSLDKINVSFYFNEETSTSETYLNGVNVESEIRGFWVSENVSAISKIKEVRHKMIHIQQKIGENKGVVMDGRDIGSVVFPNAELKLFITATADERARRRALELKDVNIEDIKENLRNRDFEDRFKERVIFLKTLSTTASGQEAPAVRIIFNLSFFGKKLDVSIMVLVRYLKCLIVSFDNISSSDLIKYVGNFFLTQFNKV